MAIQMNHHVSEETSAFLEYLGLIDDHAKMARQYEVESNDSFEEIADYREIDEDDAGDKDKGNKGRDDEAEVQNLAIATAVNSVVADAEKARVELDAIIKNQQDQLSALKAKLSQSEKTKNDAIQHAKREAEKAKYAIEKMKASEQEIARAKDKSRSSATQ